ncbi:22285_t:CDS:2, partial [Gigaspora rosea]
MCWNSCCAFTKENINCEACPKSGEPHYTIGQILKKARKTTTYFSVIDSLRMQFNDPLRMFLMGTDKSLVISGLFRDPRDIALIASTNGYQLFKKKQNDCWIILLLNANLPPAQRVKKENLIIAAVIPGPKSPKDFNSFLRPLIEELKCLEAFTQNNQSITATTSSESLQAFLALSSAIMGVVNTSFPRESAQNLLPKKSGSNGK